MRQTLLLIIVTGLVALGAGAQAEDDGNKGPKSSAVKRALAKRDRAVEQAEAAYRKAAAEANKVLLAELKKAKDAAFASKDEKEVIAVAALISETEQALEPGKGKRRERLAIDPTKGTWLSNGGSRGTYRGNGTVRFDTWAGDGKWEAVGSHTVAQREDTGRECTVTFTADGRHALWVFSNGSVGWTQRVE